MAAYWLISALLVFEKLVYHFRFLALCCLACFSNTCLMLSFALRVASAPIPVYLRLGNGVVGLKHWQIPVLILKKKTTVSEKQLNLFCHLHCCYTTQGWKHPLLLLLLEQPANVHWLDVDVTINHTTPTNLIIAFFFSLRYRQNLQK